MGFQVWYFSTPDAVPKVGSLSSEDLPKAAVVIDVLRATTTITKLLEEGADVVETFEDVAALKQAASQHTDSAKLLVGERGGLMVEGFDLGNSPVKIKKNIVDGKHIFMSTTNGTRALAKVREVGYVYCAALPNRTAVAKKIIRTMSNVPVQPNETNHIWIIGSGGEGKFSLEDTLCAGSVAEALMETADALPNNLNLTIQPANDDLWAALSVWECYKEDTEECLRKASHGKSLTDIMSKEDADADFQACAALDISEVVPQQTSPGVLRK